MKPDSGLTQQELDQLLDWLDSDRERAGEKYLEIRRCLVKFFINRQCVEAQDLADETINRVARKATGFKDVYEGEPKKFFHAVARNVYHEDLRARNKKIEPPPEPSPHEIDPRTTCLKFCLAQLSPEARKLILTYYEQQKKAKIVSHKQMGNSLGVNPGALRARIFRLRAKLKACVEECVENTPQSNDIDSAAI